MLSLPVAAVVYCSLVGVVFLVLWLWYDRREHAHFEGQRRKTSFHCIRCDRLYAAPGGCELCPCPRCGHENSRLRF